MFASLSLLCMTTADMPDHVSAFEALKREIHKLSRADAKERIEQLRRMTPAHGHQDKIDHFVVLLMENHAFDNMLGCMDRPGSP